MTMSRHGCCVLVGTDGSWHSGPVLDAAAAEASTRGLPLLIVSVVRSLPEEQAGRMAPTDGGDRSAELTDWRLREAVSRVRGMHPALEIRTLRLPDAVHLPWRIDGSAGLPEPRLLVVGARGPHDQPAFGVGTVSRDLLRASSCPVLVVPESTHVRPANPAVHADAVVAGLADDPLSGPVLRAAADEAGVRRARLRIVHCYTAAGGESDEQALARATARAQELVGATGAVDERWSALPYGLVVTDEPAAEALSRRSAAASVVVLGTRGPAALAGLSPASVSRAVVGSARCPVLLVVPGAGSAILRTGSSLPAQQAEPSREVDRVRA
jgi:nucleotide-binding universal stress UspA family protein